MAVFVLGAEKNDFGILAGFHRVARAPVEQVSVADRLLLAIGVGHLKSSLQQVAPVGRLAQVVLQTLEQGRDVGPGSQGKVLAADGAVAGGVAEAGLLSCDRARADRKSPRLNSRHSCQSR